MTESGAAGSSHEDAREFFDAMGAERYGEAIVRCVPRYREMIAMLLRYVPDDLRPQRILDLGCGSGNLTIELALAYPGAELHGVDLSGELLGECRRRLGDRSNLVFHHEDMTRLDFEPGTFDLVASTIAIHHLVDSDKASLFRKVFEWLRPGGVFTYSDQFAGVSDDVTTKHHNQWHDASRGLGASEAEWDAWKAHEAEADHHAPLPDQMAWLVQAGFTNVDCPWRHLLWTILQGRKPTG